MLPNVDLLGNLNQLDVTFNQAIETGNARLQDLCCKASILELCGWVEQCLDQIVIDSATRLALDPTTIERIKAEYVSKTYGFKYRENFQKMILSVIGFKGLERVEASPLVAPTIQGFVSSLQDLTKQRNFYAHTHYSLSQKYPDGYTSIDTPSVVRNKAANIHTFLLNYENALKQH
jgi:hypothetical protein